MKIIIFLFCAVFFNTYAFAQNLQVQSPLRLSLEAKKNRVCFGKAIQLSLRLTNESANPVVIDPAQVGYETVYSWGLDIAKGNAGGSGAIIGEPGPDYKPNFIVLKPKEAYQTTSTFLVDKIDLLRAREFRISKVYGQYLSVNYENMSVWEGILESNEIDILVSRCRRK